MANPFKKWMDTRKKKKELSRVKAIASEKKLSKEEILQALKNREEFAKRPLSEQAELIKAGVEVAEEVIKDLERAAKLAEEVGNEEEKENIEKEISNLAWTLLDTVSDFRRSRDREVKEELEKFKEAAEEWRNEEKRKEAEEKLRKSVTAITELLITGLDEDVINTLRGWEDKGYIKISGIGPRVPTFHIEGDKVKELKIAGDQVDSFESFIKAIGSTVFSLDTWAKKGDLLVLGAGLRSQTLPDESKAVLSLKKRLIKKAIEHQGEKYVYDSMLANIYRGDFPYYSYPLEVDLFDEMVRYDPAYFFKIVDAISSGRDPVGAIERRVAIPPLGYVSKWASKYVKWFVDKAVDIAKREKDPERQKQVWDKVSPVIVSQNAEIMKVLAEDLKKIEKELGKDVADELRKKWRELITEHVAKATFRFTYKPDTNWVRLKSVWGSLRNWVKSWPKKAETGLFDEEKAMLMLGELFGKEEFKRRPESDAPGADDWFYVTLERALTQIPTDKRKRLFLTGFLKGAAQEYMDILGQSRKVSEWAKKDLKLLAERVGKIYGKYPKLIDVSEVAKAFVDAFRADVWGEVPFGFISSLPGPIGVGIMEHLLSKERLRRDAIDELKIRLVKPKEEELKALAEMVIAYYSTTPKEEKKEAAKEILEVMFGGRRLYETARALKDDKEIAGRLAAILRESVESIPPNSEFWDETVDYVDGLLSHSMNDYDLGYVLWPMLEVYPRIGSLESFRNVSLTHPLELVSLARKYIDTHLMGAEILKEEKGEEAARRYLKEYGLVELIAKIGTKEQLQTFLRVWGGDEHIIKLSDNEDLLTLALESGNGEVVEELLKYYVDERIKKVEKYYENKPEELKEFKEEVLEKIIRRDFVAAFSSLNPRMLKLLREALKDKVKLSIGGENREKGKVDVPLFYVLFRYVRDYKGTERGLEDEEKQAIEVMVSYFLKEAGMERSKPLGEKFKEWSRYPQHVGEDRGSEYHTSVWKSRCIKDISEILDEVGGKGIYRERLLEEAGLL